MLCRGITDTYAAHTHVRSGAVRYISEPETGAGGSRALPETELGSPPTQHHKRNNS